MDADRFDSFTRALSLSTVRRGIVAGLLSGGLTPLLAELEGGARRRDARSERRHHEVAAEKRKKKCKKCGPCRRCKKGKCKPKPNGTPCAGGSCQKGKCKQGDEAPSCTAGVCPLPPGCTQQAIDACAAAFIERAQPSLESCRAACEAGDGPTCQACLDPIVRANLPAAQACIASACRFSIAPSGRAAESRSVEAGQQPRQVEAEAGWQRVCDKPTCCLRNLETCYENARDTLIKCLIGALAAGIRGGPGAGAAGVVVCLGNKAYDTAACLARFGCRDGECVEGDICVCPSGGTQCGSQCCHWNQTCCGGKCCPESEFEGEHYCCGNATAGKCCSREASVCVPGGGDVSPACCFPGDVPCPDGSCCAAGSHCCEGGGCCHDGDTCCFRQSSQTLFCCPPGSQCMQTGIPCCSNCG